MFFTPGFVALLLIKAGEPAAFGVTIELLLLSCATAVVGGLVHRLAIIGRRGRSGLRGQLVVRRTDSGVPVGRSLPLRIAATVSPAGEQHPAAHQGVGAVNLSLGPSELIPAVAILPFMLYQLSGFGTLGYIVSRTTNWVLNIVIFATIIAGYIANRSANFAAEKAIDGFLVALLTFVVFYGVLKLKRLQGEFEARAPAKPPKEAKEAKAAETPQSA